MLQWVQYNRSSYTLNPKKSLIIIYAASRRWQFTELVPHEKSTIWKINKIKKRIWFIRVLK